MTQPIEMAVVSWSNPANGRTRSIELPAAEAAEVFDRIGLEHSHLIVSMRVLDTTEGA